MEMKKERFLGYGQSETIRNTVKQLNNSSTTTLEVPHARKKRDLKTAVLML